jgi:hypothetical protein
LERWLGNEQDPSVHFSHRRREIGTRREWAE